MSLPLLDRPATERGKPTLQPPIPPQRPIPSPTPGASRTRIREVCFFEVQIVYFDIYLKDESYLLQCHEEMLYTNVCIFFLTSLNHTVLNCWL